MSDLSRAWKKIKREVSRPFKQFSREVGRFYERQIGRTGEIGSWEDLMKSPGQLIEGTYKQSPVYQAGKYLTGMMPEMPPIPPIPPPGPSSIQVQAAGAAEREARRKRRGYGSTMLTGGLGTATTYRKQILG